MNTEYTLQATKRENKGTSSSKKIRKNNGIPAVVYGDKNNNNIILDANEVAKQIKDSGFYSNVIQLKICLLYTSPSPRDTLLSRMPSSA